MKIAFFTDTYWPNINGVTENIETSKRALERLGHTVYVVAPKAPGQAEDDKKVYRLSAVKIIKNPEQRLVIPIPQKDLRELFKQKFDIIHIQTQGTAGLLGWEIARLRDIPCVVTYHTLLNRYVHYVLKGKIVTPKIAELGSKIFCNLCDLVVVPTERVKRELLDYGVTKEILVIAGGIEVERFGNLKTGYLRSLLGLNEDEKIILYLGRLGKEKKIDFIIRSLRGILEKEEGLYLAIVGDGPERENLIRLVKELKLEKKVLFAGFIARADVPKVYKDADIFVFSSDTETQGLTVPEAMASGLAVVVARDPAFDEVVYDGKTGLLAERSEEDFANKVKTLLSDSQLRLRLSVAGKELVREKFSSQTQAKKLISVYKKAVKINFKKRKVTRVLRTRFSLMRDFLNINLGLSKLKIGGRNGNN